MNCKDISLISGFTSKEHLMRWLIRWQGALESRHTWHHATKMQTHPIFILEPDWKPPAMGGLEANRFKCSCFSMMSTAGSVSRQGLSGVTFPLFRSIWFSFDSCTDASQASDKLRLSVKLAASGPLPLGHRRCHYFGYGSSSSVSPRGRFVSTL